MTWNGIICTRLSKSKPAPPKDGVFPPENGWEIGCLMPVAGRDDGKSLWACAVVATESDDYGCPNLTWTTVQKQKIPRPDAV